MVSALNNLGNRLLVLYDGRCGLCNRTVRWCMRRDRRDRLRFVASESPLVAALLARHGMARPDKNAASTDTILVVRHPDSEAGKILIRSQAFFAILRELPAPWPAIAAILSLIPGPLRDLGYRLVARYRYRIWGELAACPIPTAEERRRFL